METANETLERTEQHMNDYEKLRNSQQKRVNDFLHENAFFAFSKKQFQEGLQALGISGNAEEELYQLHGTGGYIRKEKAEEYRDLAEGIARELQEAIDNPETGENFAFQMFVYELANHEYNYTGTTSETLDALGMTMQEVQESAVLKNALARACEYLQNK